MSKRDKRIVTFTQQDDRLVRTVVMHDGRTYTHSCEVEVFQTVLHAFAESDKPTTLMEVADREELPYTQVNVAMEFLKERGLLDVVRRRSVAASKMLFEDGMIEFYALVEAEEGR